MINDVPIYSIVRNIEIDLKDMLGEENLPERMKPEYNVLFWEAWSRKLKEKSKKLKAIR